MNDTLEDLIKTIKKVVLIPVHPAGWPIITVAAIIFAVMWMIDDALGVVGGLLLAWCFYFFRDPVRVSPTREGLVISPADGMVCGIDKNVSLPVELDGGEEDDDSYTRISVFLNVFDVHVNRVPVAGTIKQVVYKPGKFLNASLDKASEHNERCSVLMETTKGQTVGFVQIAGLVARRIICDLKEGQEVAGGEKYGIIRFGSRADVYVPKGVNPMVCVGQRMIGGETILADFKSKEKAREGEDRP